MIELARKELGEIRKILFMHIAREEAMLKHVWLWVVVLMACSATTVILTLGLIFFHMMGPR